MYGGYSGLRWALNIISTVLLRRENRGLEKTNQGKRPCDGRGRDWNEASASQGKPW